MHFVAQANACLSVTRTLSGESAGAHKLINGFSGESRRNRIHKETYFSLAEGGNGRREIVPLSKCVPNLQMQHFWRGRQTNHAEKLQHLFLYPCGLQLSKPCICQRLRVFFDGVLFKRLPLAQSLCRIPREYRGISILQRLNSYFRAVVTCTVLFPFWFVESSVAQTTWTGCGPSQTTQQVLDGETEDRTHAPKGALGCGATCIYRLGECPPSTNYFPRCSGAWQRVAESNEPPWLSPRHC